MQIINGFQVLVIIGVGLFYLIKTRKQRAELWRKASCYCGARAVGIEQVDERYYAYLKHMDIAN